MLRMEGYGAGVGGWLTTIAAEVLYRCSNDEDILRPTEEIRFSFLRSEGKKVSSGLFDLHFCNASMDAIAEICKLM